MVEHQGAGLGKMDRDLQERLVSALEKSTQARDSFDPVEEAGWHLEEDDPSREKEDSIEAGPVLLPRPAVPAAPEGRGGLSSE